MSDVFWDAQEPDEAEEESELKYKRPWWVTVGAIVNLLLLFAVVPAGFLSLIPFFFLIYVYFAQILVWISPILILLNMAVFWWSFRARPIRRPRSMPFSRPRYWNLSTSAAWARRPGS